MRYNRYILKEEVLKGKYLYYNSFSNQFLLLNEKNNSLLVNVDIDTLEQENPNLYNLLLDGQFIVPDDFDELSITLFRKNKMQSDSSYYHVMINTTLDCNLNCWYCYENKVVGSKLSSEVIEAIKKNIVLEYETARYNTLKVSFFGGEPFMNFKGIKEVLDFSNSFCREKDIELIADFTTNAVLLNKERIDYLKQFRCHFQITLDGDREVHNRIKKDHLNPNRDTYQQTIDTLHLIEENIPNRWTAVRINFDNRTLSKIDEIISDIDFMDRHYMYVILKKVWQVNTEKVNVELLYEAIQKLFDKQFLVDYYLMPKGYVCFAERQREVLFNYDGKVFKCSTISSFNDENAFGKFDLETGIVNWNISKLTPWFKDIVPDYCKECKWFPACLGPCNKQLMAHKGERICTFDAMNMGDKEFLMYIFKYQLIQKEIWKSNSLKE